MRRIRVFISSTFEDMQAERDHLIKHIFPQLRQLCATKGVVWTEVDLRWGVPDGDIQDGRLISACLQEIDRSHPFFIGILSDRYGSIPKSDINATLAEYPLLAQNGGSSIAEMEIMHSFSLPDGATNGRYFYFRAPQSNARPSTNPGLGNSVHGVDSDRLSALKDLIRTKASAGRCRLSENYSNPEELGQFVLRDFRQLIESLTRSEGTPSKENLELDDHAAYARILAEFNVSRDDLSARLDEYFSDATNPLLIVGDSGSGKTHLLANWYLSRFRRAELEPSFRVDFALIYFVGMSQQTRNEITCLRHILMALKDRFPDVLTGELPNSIEDMRSKYADWQALIGSRYAGIIIIDGIDQMVRDQQEDLPAWLKKPEHATWRMIISSTPDRGFSSYRFRQWPRIELLELNQQTRAELVELQLSNYGKKIEPKLLLKLCSAPQTQNPLFLSLLADELRQYGDYEKIVEQVDAYLTAKNLPELYAIILARWCSDYGNVFVEKCLCALWAAREGLSERELQQIVSAGDQTIYDQWRVFSAAASSHFFIQDGVRRSRDYAKQLIRYSHDALRSAVQVAFLGNEDKKKHWHSELAQHFARYPLSQRKLDELIWQYCEAGRWEDAAKGLADEELLTMLLLHTPYEVSTLWKLIREKSGITAETTYSGVLAEPHKYSTNYRMSVAHVFNLLMSETPTDDLLSPMIDNSELNHLGWWMAARHKVGNFCATSRFDEAERFVNKALDRLKGDTNLYVDIKKLKAVVLLMSGKLDAALAISLETKDEARNTENKDAVIDTTIISARILKKLNRHVDGAIAFDEALTLCVEAGKDSTAAECMRGMADCLMEAGREKMRGKQVDRARFDFGVGARIYRDIGDRSAELKSMLEVAQTYLVGKPHRKGFIILNQVEDAFRDLVDYAGVALCLRFRISILEQLGGPELCRTTREQLGIYEALLRGEEVGEAAKKELSFRYGKSY